MAFLVELRSLGPPSTSRTQQRSVPARIPITRPDAMRLFKRNSTGPAAQDCTSDSRRSSLPDGDRKSSLASIPLRIRRRKTGQPTYKLPAEEESATQLGRLFFSIPAEIHILIFKHLQLSDIFSLRISCKAISSILDNNASAIARHFIDRSFADDVAPHACKLYPPSSSSHNLSYLLKMLHRQERIDRVIYHTASYVQMKMYTLNIPGYLNIPAPGSMFRIRVQTALQTPAWTAYHFLETYRDLVLYAHNQEHEIGAGRFWACETCESETKKILHSYPREEIVPALHLFQLLLLHYRVSTRVPSYGTAMERRIKSRGKEPSEDEMDMFVLLGGLEELSKISQMQGSYAKRMEVVSSFIGKVRAAVDINEANAKSGSGPLRARSVTDMTKSLGPDFSIMRQDHLDRLPSLPDFLLPVWLEHIEKENLHFGEEEDLHSPFLWMQRVVLGQDGNGNGDEQDTNDTGNGQPLNNPPAVPTPTAFTPVHTLIPVFGASPV